VDPAAAYEKLHEYQFVDVRQAYEWAAGHVEGAKHITLQEIPRRLEEAVRSTPVVFVCQIGQRSGIAAEFALERGYEAHNLDGGVELWVKQGFPLVNDSQGRGEVVDGWAETLEWDRNGG
jgi:rhodanese-related sulfurtransferase